MKQVSVMPTTGRFVAVYEREGQLYCDTYKWENGFLKLLVKGSFSMTLDPGLVTRWNPTYLIAGNDND